MAFQLKNFASITASILNHIRGTTSKITDLVPGSVARTLAEAPAIEIEELYMQMFLGLKEAIPVATFKSFSFDALTPAYAIGNVTISRDAAATADISVPAGTIFTSTDGRQYLSRADATFLKSATILTVSVIAAAAGSAYNISAGSITSGDLFDASYTITNVAIANGRDAESDDERQIRFADYIASLSRGTTYACIYAANQAALYDSDGNITEYVTRTGMTETQGYVKVFLYSSAGIPSAELIAAAQLAMDGYKDTTNNRFVSGTRAGGVRVDVIAMIESGVDLTAVISMLSGYTFDAATTTAITSAFNTLLTSIDAGDVLYVTDIETAILSVAGVATVRLSATENLTCPENTTLVVGTVDVSEAA